jgi:hypothetical protein
MGRRDSTLIQVAYRHGLRSSELVDLPGMRSTSKRPPCTSVGSRRALPARTPSSGTSCASCGGCSASRLPGLPSSSPPNAERRLRPLASLAWWSVRLLKPSSGSKLIPTCFGTPAGTRSRIEGMTRGRCRPISAMATSSTRCATPKCRRRGSKTFGGADLAACIPSSKVAGATGPRGLLSAMRPALASAPANPPSGTAAPTGNNGKSHRLKRCCSARLRRHTGVAARPLHCHRAVTASLFGREVALHRLDCRSRPPRVGGHHPAPALTRNPSLTSSRETPLSCQSLDSPVKFSIAHGSG